MSGETVNDGTSKWTYPGRLCAKPGCFELVSLYSNGDYCELHAITESENNDRVCHLCGRKL